MYKLLYIVFFSIIVISCSKTPDIVIPENDMINLMIDIHKGEAYVDRNSSIFYNDSLKKAFKQSIFLKHDVTSEQFDSSLVWYGHHITEYTKMYEEIIKQLEEQDKVIMAEAKKEGELTLLASGDSINMWNKNQFRILSNHAKDTLITFDYKADNDFKKGDRFQWAYRMLNSSVKMKIFMGIDYKDGSISFLYKDAPSDGWNKFILQSDSTRDVNRIYGYIAYSPKAKEVAFLDSIQLVRTRVDKSKYYNFYSQKSIVKKIPTPVVAKDSTEKKNEQ